jgi:hypothetical protein
MTAATNVRSLACLVAIAALSLSSLFSAAAAQPIGITPSTVHAGSSATLSVSSSAFFINLTQVSIKQLSFSPAQGISNLQISSAAPERMIITFNVAKDASGGPRTLNFNLTEDVTVSVRFSVAGGTVPGACTPACPPDAVCISGKCLFK